MLNVDFALRSDRTMKALTGLSRAEFQTLCPSFAQVLSEQVLSRRPHRQRKPGAGGKYRLDRVEAKLFFILMYIKCYPTFDVASVLYQVHRSRPHRWVQSWLPALEQALGYEVVLPERRIDQVETFFARFPQVKDLWLDGTERPIRRPQDAVIQKRHYRGKKKRPGVPGYIRSDNGSEFIANKVQAWLKDHHIKTIYIEPGSPWQNGYIESFHSRFRDECLNREWLLNLREARVVIEDWRLHYNTERPHSRLGYLSPEDYIKHQIVSP